MGTEGFEPPTCGLEDHRSILLSYVPLFAYMIVCDRIRFVKEKFFANGQKMTSENFKIDRYKRKYNREIILKALTEEYGENYKFPDLENTDFVYKNFNQKIRVICKKHGEYVTNIGTVFVKKKKCRKCFFDNLKYTVPILLQKFEKLYGNYYTYEPFEYDNPRQKISIVCPLHGKFEKTIYAHLSGKGCPECKKTQMPKDKNPRTKYNREILLEMFSKKFSKNYRFPDLENPNFVYRNRKQKIKVICEKHGEFFSRIANLLNGCGCRKCGIESMREKIKKKFTGISAQDTFTVIRKFSEIHGKKYIYPPFEYKNNKQKIEIICRKHGSFFMTVKSHMKGSNCPECGKEYKANIFSKKDKRKRSPKNRVHMVSMSKNLLETWKNYEKEGIEVRCRICSRKISEHREKEIDICSHWQIFSRLEKFGFDSKVVGTPSVYSEWKKVRNFLHRIYVKEKKSITEIKNEYFPELSTTHGNVDKILKYMGIKRRSVRESLLLDSKEFSRRVKKYNPEYDFSITEYSGRRKKVKFVCPNHGQVVMRASSLLRGARCPKCSAKEPKWEKEIFEFLLEEFPNYDYERWYRLPNKKEIDIYISDLRFGIECHGLYWHSNLHVEENYHFEKWKDCHEQGIALFTFFEDEWEISKNVMRRVLKSFLEEKIVTNLQKRIVPKKEFENIYRKYSLDSFEESEEYWMFYDNSSVIFGLSFSVDKEIFLRNLFFTRRNSLNFLKNTFEDICKITGKKKIYLLSNNRFHTTLLEKQNLFTKKEIYGPSFEYVSGLTRSKKEISNRKIFDCGTTKLVYFSEK